MSEDGISHLILSNGDTISADLYVDCTGFKSLLLGGYLKEPFTSYSDILPNNRSWAAQIQYEDKEKELEGFTNCTALKNGWAWNTPLWSRLGTGYVYSDKYISPEDAKEEFKQYLMSNKMAVPRTREQVDSLTYKDVHIKVGIHERTWVKNVVAIGLSAGFIEPLESNGLFSVFRFIAALSKSLLREEVSKLDRDVYNYAVKGMFDNFTEFVALHYALSVRRDTEYWTDVSKRTYSKTIENMEPSSLQGVFDLQNRKMFTNIPDTLAGISYISVGMNYHFFDRVTQKLNIVGNNIKPYVDSNLKLFNAKKSQWNKAAENAPSLNKYLEDNIYDN
jgi:tryptophan halogenase